MLMYNNIHNNMKIIVYDQRLCQIKMDEKFDKKKFEQFYVPMLWK